MLYGTRTYNDIAQLRDILNGTPVKGASGSLGTNLATNTALGVPVASGAQGDFTNAAVGDRVIIFGESGATVFLIATKTDNQNVILDNAIVSPHTGDAQWRVVKNDAIPVASIQFGGPISSTGHSNGGTVVYSLP